MNKVNWYLVPYTNLFYLIQYTNLFLDIVKKSVVSKFVHWIDKQYKSVSSLDTKNDYFCI